MPNSIAQSAPPPQSPRPVLCAAESTVGRNLARRAMLVAGRRAARFGATVRPLPGGRLGRPARESLHLRVSVSPSSPCSAKAIFAADAAEIFPQGILISDSDKVREARTGGRRVSVQSFQASRTSVPTETVLSTRTASRDTSAAATSRRRPRFRARPPSGAASPSPPAQRRDRPCPPPPGGGARTPRPPSARRRAA